jgi:hypothetical protein
MEIQFSGSNAELKSIFGLKNKTISIKSELIRVFGRKL